MGGGGGGATAPLAPPLGTAMLVALFVSYIVLRRRRRDGEIVNLADSRMDCFLCLATLSVLVVRISLLEYSKIMKRLKVYSSKCIT